MAVPASDLIKGNYVSCPSCKFDLASKRTRKHGMTNSRLYYIWRGMKVRCENPNSVPYKDYGARGIFVCEEWHNFETFMNWAINNGYSDDLTIDRIDVNDGYYPENCRWVTMDVQNNNKRTVAQIEIDGITKPISFWSKLFNVKHGTIYRRYRSKYYHNGIDYVFGLNPTLPDDFDEIIRELHNLYDTT